MKILYVFAHPNAQSWNAELRKAGYAALRSQGHEILETDLYQMDFNAIASFDDFEMHAPSEAQYFIEQKKAHEENRLPLDIQAEMQKIQAADHIILHFPLWWFGMPAILKGWLDRVLVKGFAYDTGKVFTQGLLNGKTVSLVVTTQSDEAAYQTQGMHEATLNDFLLPIYHALRFVGVGKVEPFAAYQVFNLTAERKQEIVEDYRRYLKIHLGSFTCEGVSDPGV